MLKSYGVGGGGVGGLEQFSVSPRPLGFGFGTLALRVWGQGLTKMFKKLVPGPSYVGLKHL